MRNWLLVGVLGAAVAACGPEPVPTDGGGGGDAPRDNATQDMAVRLDVPAVDTPVVDTPVADNPAVDTSTTDVTPADTTPVDVASMDATTPDVPTPIDSTVPDMGPPPDATTSDATTPVDAAVDTMIRPDVPADAMRGTSPLFGRCTADINCRDADGVCLSAYPGGLCSRGCANDAACGTGGRCFMGACLPRCSLGGTECSTSTACFVIDNVDTSRRACFPSCWGAPPVGVLTCNAGFTCDEWSGDCSTMASMGAPNGAACTMNSDCRGGRCITELNMTTPTGWLGGYCFSTGRVPSLFDYMIDAPIPRSNCPAGSVAIPADNLGDEGDVALCLLACTSAAGCRAGYECAFLDDGMGGRTTNGYCAPFNCLAAGAIACPTGTTCRDVTPPGGTRRGVCAR